MPKKTYDRKDPAAYAAQRLALGVRVRDGMAVRAAARFLKIPYSTAWLWVAQDGLRQGDLAAEEAGAPRPPIGAWAKPGRGRKAPESDGSLLPPADYPELKGLTGSARLTKLHGLALTARMRAVAAIEEGCIDYALGALREADKLSRAWRALKDWLERYPDAGGRDDETDRLQADVMEILKHFNDPDWQPVVVPDEELSPGELVDRRVWEAISRARNRQAEELGLTPEERRAASDWTREEDNREYWRLKGRTETWMSIPGRELPQIEAQVPAWRGR